jgi:hypothetical protein
MRELRVTPFRAPVADATHSEVTTDFPIQRSPAAERAFREGAQAARYK